MANKYNRSFSIVEKTKRDCGYLFPPDYENKVYFSNYLHTTILDEL